MTELTALDIAPDLAGVGIAHHFGGGVYAKETVIPAGCALSQHAHPHEHLSILASGRVEVSVGDARRTLAGPACITIPAGLQHTVTALTDVVWFCVHATEDTDADTVDDSILFGGLPTIIGAGAIPESQGVVDVQRALRGHPEVVLLAHAAKALNQKIPESATIYNLEPLYDGCRSLSTEYLPALRAAKAVWDYQRPNVAYLRTLGIQATHVPYRYTRELERTVASEKSIDVLFVGSSSPRRLAVLTDLGRHCVVEHVQGCYGHDLDAKISSARVVLNVHFTDVPHPLEVVRLNYLLANGCAVVSERGWDEEENAEYAPGVVFSDDVVTACLSLLSGDWRGLGRRGQELIRSMPMRAPAHVA